jgi:hypothetical protein
MLSEYRQHCTDIETTTWNMFHCLAAGITAGMMLRTLVADIKALTDSTVGPILEACRNRGFLIREIPLERNTNHHDSSISGEKRFANHAGRNNT